MPNLTRRNFVGAAAAAAGAALGGGPAHLHAQLVARTKDWNIESFKQLVHTPASLRQVYDVAHVGGGKFLNNVKNSLNGLQYGFGLPAEQIQIAVALHGHANMVNYDDTVWEKYRVGEWLKVTDPKTGKPATRNIFYSAQMPHFASTDVESEGSMIQSKDIHVLQSRGVRFMSCHTANEEQAPQVISRLHLSETPDQVVKDWQSHALPGVLIVASMVAAIAVLQCEGRYSYITV